MVVQNGRVPLDSTLLSLRVVSGPPVLTKVDIQRTRNKETPPPYSPSMGVDKCDIQPSVVYSTRVLLPYLQDVEHAHSSVLYQAAPAMQRDNTCSARPMALYSPADLASHNLNHRHRQPSPVRQTDEEKLLVRGCPSIINRGPYEVAYFTAVQEFANYARAKTLIERGYIESRRDPVTYLKGSEVHDPPAYTELSSPADNNFVGVELNGFLFQDRKGTSPSYFGYRWL